MKYQVFLAEPISLHLVDLLRGLGDTTTARESTVTRATIGGCGGIMTLLPGLLGGANPSQLYYP